MMHINLLLINKISFFFKKQKTRVTLLSFALFIISNDALTQINYVQNPSFEELDSCKNNPNFDYPPRYWDTLRAGGGGGPEICSTCSNFSGLIVPKTGLASYQMPKTGNNYCFYTSYRSLPSVGEEREYIQNELKKNLIAGKKYCVTYNLSLMNESKYAITEFGGYFDDGSINTSYYGASTLVPQVKTPAGVYLIDTLNWIKFQGVFTAIGSEKYLTLGNFKANSNTTFTIMPTPLPPFNIQRSVADYYIDDVSVIEYDLPAYAGRDTVICTGDSVFIGRPPEIGLECLWFSGGSQIATGGGLWVKPATTQTFMVQQDVCGLIKTSTVSVQVKPPYTGTTQLTSNISAACLSDSVKLSVINPPAGIKIKYDWLPYGVFTSTTNLQAITFIKQNTTFTSNITSKGEDAFCPFAITNTVNVIVPDSCFKDPQIPNIFTPNSDGINDVWSIKFPYGFKMETLTVYNRWGTLIYERNNLNFKLENYAKIGWDGRTTSGQECTDGVYFYVLKYTNKNGEEKLLKGNVTLLR